MGTKDSSAFIEHRTIAKLTDYLLGTKKIMPDIHKNDTDISWDGHLTVYSNEKDFGTINAAGRIPVQVKGTSVNQIENGRYVYNAVKIADLNNYRKDGGCLYFVILLLEDDFKIYYKSLLPFDLEKIFLAKKDQKTTTLYLDSFPKNTKTIMTLMEQFLDEREKQYSTAKYAFNPFSPEAQTRYGIDDITFTLRGTRENPFETCFEIPTYFYAQTLAGPQIPVQKIHFNSVSLGDLPNPVYVNDVQHYKKITYTKTKNCEIITLGKSTTLTVANNDNVKEAILNFSEQGTLLERIQDVAFWFTVCSTHKCRLSCTDIFDGTINGINSDEGIERLKQRLIELKNLKQALDYFGIFEDLVFNNLDDKDEFNLNQLIHASRDEELSITVKDYVPASTLKISNLNIFIYVNKLANGKFKIENFFSKTELKARAIQGDDECDISPFMIMHKDDMIHSSNINYDVVYDSITSISCNLMYIDLVNSFLLEAICAYDEKENEELFIFINKLSEWLLMQYTSESQLLNLLQVKKRERKLTKDEQEELREIAANSDQIIVKIGACILLESFLEANTLWKKLSEDSEGTIKAIKSFSSFPIFNLWAEHKPDDL